jgi:hypothetical protein
MCNPCPINRLYHVSFQVNEDQVALERLFDQGFTSSISEYLTVPKKKCFIDRRKKAIIDREYTINKIWSLG